MPLTPYQLSVLRRVLPSTSSVGNGGVVFDGKSVGCNGGIARFREDSGYNASFALQWTKFQLNQYDSVNGTTLYRDRYARETSWSLNDLEGEMILEAGCGAGAFTCHLAATGGDLVSFDFSAAVDVAAEHNADGKIVFAQADILDMPFSDSVFDRVFCHGVLQHTPDPEQAFRELDKRLRPGGQISVDVYHKDGKIRPWKSKYLWRPLTTCVQPDSLMKFLRWFIPKWLPFDTFIKRIPYLANYLGAIVPCWNYHFTTLSPEQKVEWAVMDTFDALAPVYDIPVTRKQLEGWFRDCGYTEFEVREGGNGLVGNGRKPTIKSGTI